MFPRLRYLVRISGDRDRRLIILGLILAIICVALYINLTIMLSKPSSSQSQERIQNETNETTDYITGRTSTNLPYAGTTKKFVTNQSEKYANYSLSTPVQFENFGHSLDQSLYFNLEQFCSVTGYIGSISLRLFSEWKGNAPLYLFILSSNTELYKISYRYAITPQRNTTEWQTIKIPSHTLSISLGNNLAVGMQENSNSSNQIHAVKSHWGMSGTNININMTAVAGKSDGSTGVAFSYTVIYNV